MTTPYINTELFLANTTNNIGTINLPVASSIPGRVLEFKDSNGRFQQNSLTLLCNGPDTFEDGSSSKVMNTRFGNLQLVASGNKWYILNGTQVNTFQVSSLTTIGISSFLTNTSSINVSSIGLIDNVRSTNILNVSTSFLFYNNFIISGTRVGYSNVFNKYSLVNVIKPTQIGNLSLWYDAADPTSIILSGSNVIQWNDKSGNGKNAVASGGSYTNPVVGSVTWNGTQVISFDSNAEMQIPNFAISAQPRTIFMVYQVPSGYTGYPSRSIGVLTRIASGAQAFSIGGANACSIGVNSIENKVYTYVGYSTSNILIFSVVNSDITAANNIITFNGTSSLLNISATASSYETAPQTYQLATAYLRNTSYGVPFNLAEIMEYGAALTPQQRQQIEGYLAWKWGLNSTLPSSHPWFYFPPY